MTTAEKIIILVVVCANLTFFTMGVITNNNAKEIDQLITKNLELQSKLNIKNVEYESIKRDIEEAHETMGVLFVEAMDVTDRYNELRAKKCKGGK